MTWLRMATCSSSQASYKGRQPEEQLSVSFTRGDPDTTSCYTGIAFLGRKLRVDASGGRKRVYSNNLARMSVGCHCGRPRRLGSSEELKSGSREKGNRPGAGGVAIGFAPDARVIDLEDMRGTME